MPPRNNGKLMKREATCKGNILLANLPIRIYRPKCFACNLQKATGQLEQPAEMVGAVAQRLKLKVIRIYAALLTSPYREKNRSLAFLRPIASFAIKLLDYDNVYLC